MRIDVGENDIHIFGENGRVSRFNSGDLAGKCETSNRFLKNASRKIIACPFPLYRFNGFNGLLFDQADNLCNLVNP